MNIIINENFNAIETEVLQNLYNHTPTWSSGDLRLVQKYHSFYCHYQQARFLKSLLQRLEASGGDELTISTTWGDFSEHCQERVTTEVERRPGNALNIEIGSPAIRCLLKTPEYWPYGATGLRWVFSGGSPLVLGDCNKSCPRLSKGL